MVWKIGPACVAQQAKNVSASTMNGAETSASETRVGECSAAAPRTASPGACRTNKAAGMSSAQTSTPMVSCALRQSWLASSQAASGEIVIGATPMPAETSDTARLRLRVSHEVTEGRRRLKVPTRFLSSTVAGGSIRLGVRRQERERSGLMICYLPQKQSFEIP